MTEETQAQTEVQAQPQQAVETVAAPVAQPQQAQAPQKKNTCLLISLIFGAICFAFYLLIAIFAGLGMGVVASSASADLAAEAAGIMVASGVMGFLFFIPAVLSLIGLIFIARAWKHSNKKHALIAAILFTCAFVILGYWNLFTIPAAVLGYVGFYQINKLNK